MKCSKARNEYLLNLAAANTSMKKYYLHDISALIDVSAPESESVGFFSSAAPLANRCVDSDQCADAGYHLSLGQVMQAYLSGRMRTQQNLGRGLQQLQETVSALDQVRDRDTLLQEHNNTFCMPLRFSYQPHDGDQVCSGWSAEHAARKQNLAVTLSFFFFFFLFCPDLRGDRRVRDAI